METLPTRIETIQDVKDFAEYIKVVDNAAISPDDSFNLAHGSPKVFSFWDELRFFLEFCLSISKLFVIFVV